MDHFVQSLFSILRPEPILFLIMGTALGIVFGSIPGLTGGMLMVLVLPLTFFMKSEIGIILLISIYVGGVTGGLITAILLRIPGAPSNVMTTFDGYPMAQRGQAERALALAISASFVGGMISWVFLVALSPPITRLALKLSNFEYFSFVVMGIVLISSVAGKSILYGLASGFLGMLIATPGIDPASGILRMDYGFYEFAGGFNILPVMIGIFAGSQLISEMININRPMPKQLPTNIKRLVADFTAVFRHVPNLLRSSIIGTWVGILPGIGANIGAILSYTVAKNVSRHPDEFGTGSEEGIVASEAANNATVCGALIPLITMGIPGSIGDAILIAALFLHNVEPGPLLLLKHPDTYYGIIAAALGSNVMILFLMILFVPIMGKIIQVPKYLTIPIILVFCVVGSFGVNNRMFDAGVMFIFAIIGFAMDQVRLPLGPFIIGMVLAPIAETKLRAALMSSAGDFMPLIQRPVSLVCLLTSLGIFFWPLIRKIKWRKY